MDSTFATVTDGTYPITVAMAPFGNPSGATLAGTTTVLTVDGIATFTDLTIDRRAPLVALEASSPAIIGVISHRIIALAPMVASDMSAGSDHTCAVTTSGEAYCWGGNASGELGDGTTLPRSLPVQVSGTAVFAGVRAGNALTCGVTSGGTAYCWGSNLNGKLGDSTLVDRITPVPVSGGLTFKGIWSGFYHSCGLTTADAAYCWGGNNVGQLGDSNPPIPSTTPVAVRGGLAFSSLSTSHLHTCGVTPGGAAYCWGGSISGALGDSTTAALRTVPSAVRGGLTFSGVSAGVGHTCGVTLTGAAYCWGSNFYGQLGDGASTTRVVPVPVAGGHTFSSVSAGGEHTCGVVTSGRAYCWGRGLEGQLGNGDVANALLPSAIAAEGPFVRVSAGFHHTCALAQDGAVLCWGANGSGQLGRGDSTASNVPLRLAY